LIDIFSLFLTHGLIVLAIVRLLMRKDLDVAGEGTGRKGLRQRNAGVGSGGDQGRPGA
jgi:hypothetical protein